MGAITWRLARSAAAEPFRVLAWLARVAGRGGALAGRGGAIASKTLTACADWIEGG